MITKCGGTVPVGITKTAASKLIEKLKNAVNTNRMERQNEKEVSA
jgi:hypothetical protein